MALDADHLSNTKIKLWKSLLKLAQEFWPSDYKAFSSASNELCSYPRLYDIANMNWV